MSSKRVTPAVALLTLDSLQTAVQLRQRICSLFLIHQLQSIKQIMGSVVDWDTKVVIGSKARATTKVAGEKDVAAARRTGGVVDTEKKAGVGNKTHADPDHQRIAALDRKDDPTAPATVSMDVGKAMQKARQDLKLSQKDLAAKVNEKPTVIQDYEGGKAIPSPQLLAKLERTLKVKLRGKDIGSPLLSPSEKKALEAEKAGAKKK